MIGALAGVGAMVAKWPGGRRRLAVAAVFLAVLVPTGLRHAALTAHFAFKDIEVAVPSDDDSGRHYRDRTFFGERLEADWELYAWLKRSLPTDSRLLAELRYTAASAAAAGVATPQSHRDYQFFLFGYTTSVYEDAIRFLNRDDLAALGITHLHVTETLTSKLDPAARLLLDSPDHFRPMVEIVTSSGTPHQVYRVMPGAGAVEIAPSSYRALQRLVPRHRTVTTLGSLSHAHRLVLMTAFVDHKNLQSTIPLRFERASRSPDVTTISGQPASGVVILRELVEPIALGASRDEALWNGHGLRAYDLGAAWSPPWRVWPDRAPLPEAQRFICESATDGRVDLRLLGEPGAVVTAGRTEVTLTGQPQIVQVAVPDCGALTLSADAGLAPFVQIRPHFAGAAVDVAAPTAGLGFDSSVEGDLAILNFWYRNPDDIPFVTGSSFRLYAADASGVSYHQDYANPLHAAVRWWSSPVILRSPEQAARVEFDGRRLTINGDPGAGSAASLEPGRPYLLALTVSGSHPRETWEEIQHIIPVARVRLSESGVDYDVFSGIVTIEHRAPGT